MNIGSISAGTGPAAAILVGGIMILAGIPAGWLILLIGVGISIYWASRFR